MNENTLLMAMIFGQSILIFIALGFVVYFSLKFHKKDKLSSQNPTQKNPQKKEVRPVIQPTKAPLSVGMCDTHPNARANGHCAICEKLLCEDCNMESEKLHFCPEHYALFTENDWGLLQKVKTTPETTEESAHLFEFKNDKWKNEKVPMYVEIHYQINIENDQIESDVALYALKDQATHLKEQLEVLAKKEKDV